jgi:hypothetical protein
MVPRPLSRGPRAPDFGNRSSRRRLPNGTMAVHLRIDRGGTVRDAEAWSHLCRCGGVLSLSHSVGDERGNIDFLALRNSNQPADTSAKTRGTTQGASVDLIRILVQLFNEPFGETLTVPLNSTVSALKQRLSETTGVAISEKILTVKTRVLQDHGTLSHSYIKEGSIVVLTRRGYTYPDDTPQNPTPAFPRIRIKVQMGKGEAPFEVITQLHHTGQQLKLAIAQQLNPTLGEADLRDWILKFSGQTIENSKPLGKYRIKNDATVTLGIRFRGGGKQKTGKDPHQEDTDTYLATFRTMHLQRQKNKREQVEEEDLQAGAVMGEGEARHKEEEKQERELQKRVARGLRKEVAALRNQTTTASMEELQTELEEMPELPENVEIKRIKHPAAIRSHSRHGGSLLQSLVVH